MSSKVAITIVSTVVYAAASACFAQAHDSFGAASLPQQDEKSRTTPSDRSLEDGANLTPIESPGTELKQPSVSAMDNDETGSIEDGSPPLAPTDNGIPADSFTQPALMPGAPDANSTIAEVDGPLSIKSDAAGETAQ